MSIFTSRFNLKSEYVDKINNIIDQLRVFVPKTHEGMLQNIEDLSYLMKLRECIIEEDNIANLELLDPIENIINPLKKM